MIVHNYFVTKFMNNLFIILINQNKFKIKQRNNKQKKIYLMNKNNNKV